MVGNASLWVGSLVKNVKIPGERGANPIAKSVGLWENEWVFYIG